jgi:hypothetical protein
MSVGNAVSVRSEDATRSLGSAEAAATGLRAMSLEAIMEWICMAFILDLPQCMGAA